MNAAVQSAPKKSPSILQPENAPYFPPAPAPTVMTSATGGVGKYRMTSVDSDRQSYMQYRAYRPNQNEADSDDDSDDEPEEEDGAAPTAAQKNQQRQGKNARHDSDDEMDHHHQNNGQSGAMSLAMRRTSMKNNNNAFATNPMNSEQLKLLLRTETNAWQIPVSEPLVDPHDTTPFPVEEIDSIHVQYLAAARGDWDESVGLRRLNEGISEEIIAAYIENNFTPIHLAAFLGNYKIIVEFVEQGGLNPHTQDANGDSPLHCATKRGHLLIVKYLIENCQSPLFIPNSNGIIPLQYALKGGYLQIIQYMMETKTLPPGSRVLPSYIDDKVGGTLLHWACLSKRIDLVEYLLVKQNIPLEQLAKQDKTTALHWACYSSSLEVVKYLIENAFANVNIKSGAGWSCLHFATASGSKEKAEYLMDVVQLKLTDRDNYHQSPFDVARGACLIMLQERKAKGFVTGSIAEKKRRNSNAEKK